MNKKPTALSVLLLGASIALAACSSGSNDSDPSAKADAGVPSPQASASVQPSPTASPTEAGGADNTGSEQEAGASSWLGEWKVTGDVASTPVSTGPDEALKGQQASFSKESARFGDAETANPVYEEKTLTAEQFTQDYRMQLSDIGIDAGEVQTVEIKDFAGPSGMFFVKDDSTLLMLLDGVFYELVRA
ncbi:hypothetical protein HGI30_03640 [Paenibacillus albicereus]|uniref:DUF4309 domain-containing protein n=1 Tax=Paenibacillus albicereus TaxID=2726185 RepID=A0A6H2GTN3_9BACL|nr:hypothetical protein [Paenibacillus albicereus]QJC50752.1 hypothetical protein HGI30_03640 [Paenibacillus albicereus]